MKKTLLAIIALLAGITLIVTLALALTRSPGRYVEGWQTVVDGYIEHKGWTSARKATIAQAVEARTPENFDQETDLRTNANGPYYVVDEPFSGLNGSKPLPYPPEEVWCVLLKRSDGDTPT
jgi:hypothetical protein